MERIAKNNEQITMQNNNSIALIKDLIGNKTKADFDVLTHLINERPDIKTNITKHGRQITNIKEKVKLQEEMFNDPNSLNFILKNGELVCNCEGECTCILNKIATKVRVDSVVKMIFEIKEDILE